MYRYAEMKYGRVYSIFETEMEYEDLLNAFSKSTAWIDVTPFPEVQEGWIYSAGLFRSPSKNTVRSLEEIKAAKIEQLKAVRDKKEVEVIEYNGSLFDYDDKSRERMRIAQDALEYADKVLTKEDTVPNSIVWTTADNKRVTLVATDFDKINAIAATRSNELHVKYNELKVMVNACEDKKEVLKVVWKD